MGEQADRSERAARNQAMYRAVNERVSEINQASDSLFDGLGDWVCECANTDCSEPVQLTHEEYEAVRTTPTRFVVRFSDAHVFPEVENVVERHERYWVVEKVGVAAELVAEQSERDG